MSSANSVILRLPEAYPAFRKVFLYYNLYVRNLSHLLIMFLLKNRYENKI